MRAIFIFLISEMTAIISITGAVILAYYQRDGWGWLILVSLLSQTSSAVFKKSKEE
jgi:hypothetical protein